MMSKNCVLLLILLVSFSIQGQKVRFNKGKAAQKKYLAQVQYKEIKGKLIIPVQIEGKEYQFLFDTGAPNLIGHHLKSQISAKELKVINVNDANSSSRPLEVVEIPLLQIAGIDFKNSPAIVNDEASNFLFECLGIDGIIGSNLLRNSIVQIDANKKQIVLTNQLSELVVPSGNSLDMALSSAQSSPYIWIDLEGEGEAKEQVLIDTGAQGFYDLSFNSFDVLNGHQIFSRVEKAYGYKGIGLFGIAEPKLHYRVQVPQISILNGVFENVISVSTGAKKSRIGSDLLEFGIVTLDYKHRRFYFEPYKNRFDLNEEVWDFSPTMKDSALVVGLVWQKNLAKKVNYGDKIIQINELQVEGEDVCDLLIKDSPIKKETHIHIVIKDSIGTLNSFDMTKRFLYQKAPQIK